MVSEERLTSFDPNELLRHSRWLRNVPFLKPDDSIRLEAITNHLAQSGAGDFTWSNDFSPGWLASLMRFGFLPMVKIIKIIILHFLNKYFSSPQATNAGPNGLTALLPKLHQERCVLRIDSMHIQRGTRKVPFFLPLLILYYFFRNLAT